MKWDGFRFFSIFNELGMGPPFNLSRHNSAVDIVMFHSTESPLLHFETGANMPTEYVAVCAVLMPEGDLLSVHSH